jgi:hypothetical protein
MIVQKNAVYGRIKSDTARVSTEYYLPDSGRFIDIVLEDGGVFIAIEVKIRAGDQEKQVADYAEFARKKNGGVPVPVLYLTPDGKKAPEDADEAVYERLSFKADILPWLNSCREATPSTSRVRDNIAQLVEAVESFCGKPEDAEMNTEIFKLVTQSDESVRAALEVSKNVDFGKTAWDAFKGPIYEMILAAWPQGSVDCISGEDGWNYLWLDFKDGKFGLSVNYLWDQVELKTEDGSDANSPEGKALYEKMSAEFDRRPAPPQANIVWSSRGLWWPGFANDELYQFHLYKLYTEKPQEVADRIIAIARALEGVRA